LGEEHDAVGADGAGAGDQATVDGEETGDKAGNGGFTGAVGAGDQEVVAGVDDEGEGVEEFGAAVGVD